MTAYETSKIAPKVDLSATEVTDQAAPRQFTRYEKRAIFAATAGTVVEYTDWIIYASFAPIIATQFFSPANEVSALLSTFAIFAIGFLMRPIGGALLGIYADRYGRKKALTLSISLMAVASTVIGLCPTYGSIGIAATIILVVARLTQGFSAGAEYGSATTYMIESAPDSRRGFAGSWQWFAINVGILFSFLIGLATLSIGPSVGMATWGWRVAFIFAGALGFFGLWIRRSVEETAIFRRHREAAKHRRPIYEVIFKYPRASLRVIGISMAGNITGYVWIVLYPSYVTISTGLSLRDALLAASIAMALSLLVIPLLGVLSDRIGRRPVLIAFAFGSALYAWPSFELLQPHVSFWTVLALQCGALIIFSGFAAPAAATMAEQFPTEIRVTGISLPYALSVSVFGGLSPYLLTAMRQGGYGHLVWVYVACICVLGGIVYVSMPETKGKSLQ